MNRVFNILACILLVMLFTTCKKYPENNLWFKSPEKAFMGGKIIAYTVDGIDSIPMWNYIYNTYPYNGFPAPQGSTYYDIKNSIWEIENDYKIISSSYGTGNLSFYNHKKNLHISFTMYKDLNNQYPKYTIFYTKDSDWKILKLTSKGDMRIQRTYNNKVYEIEFKH